MSEKGEPFSEESVESSKMIPGVNRWRRIDFLTEDFCTAQSHEEGRRTHLHRIRVVLESTTDKGRHGSIRTVNEVRYCPECDTSLIRFTPKDRR